MVLDLLLHETKKVQNLFTELEKNYPLSRYPLFYRKLKYSPDRNCRGGLIAGGRQILENSKLGGHNKVGWVEKSDEKLRIYPKSA